LLHIFVDADACPVKRSVPVSQADIAFMSHWLPTLGCEFRNERWIALEVVEEGFDAADDWIVEHVQPHDIVVTADVPLASRCLKGGAHVIGPTGKSFTENNIG